MPVASNIITTVRSSGPNPTHVEMFPYRSLGPVGFVGPRLSDDEARQFTSVHRALEIIAAPSGGLPVHVFDKREHEQRRVENAATRFIWDSPNPEDTRMTVWGGVIHDKAWTGNAFLFVSKNANGSALRITRLYADRFEVGRLKVRMGNSDEWIKVYRLDGNRDQLYFDYSLGGEIVHIMGIPDKTGLKGIDPRPALMRALGLAKAADEYSTRLFTQDSMPRGVLSSDQTLSQEQATALQERWEERHGGTNAGRVAVLGHGTTFHPISINPVDAELLESRRFQVTEVARLFGIPPHLLADQERSTSWGSGLEESNKMLLIVTIGPHLIACEQAVDKHLIGPNYYMKFETGGLLRGSKLEQYQAHRLAGGGAPWMTINELRALDELPPIEGGDEMMLPLNMGNPGSLPGDTPVGDTAGDPEARALSNGHIDQTRCPDCNKLLGMGLQGIAWCVRCKGEKVLV